MKLSQRLMAAAAALVMLSATAGCNVAPVVSQSNQRVTLDFSWWGNDTRNRYTIEAIDKFQELHPEIRVECSYSEWSGFETRNKVQMISDTEADVMQINFGWLTTYSADGTGYYDINELTDTFQISNFTESQLAYGMMEGHLNAVPIAMNTETVYINKSIYDKYGLDVPRTWNDLFNAAKVMQPDGIYPMSAAKKSMWLYLIAYAEQVGDKSFIRDTGALNFTAEDFKTMMQFYRRLTNEGVVPVVEQYERLNLDNEMYAGAVAWISDAQSYFGTAVENGREIVCADYTSVDGTSSGEGWYAKPATMYAISKNTQHPREAAMLLDYLLNSEEMATLQGIEKGIPLSSAALATVKQEGLLEGIQYDASQKMQGVSFQQLSPVMEESGLIDAFFTAANDVLFDVTPAEEAAAAFYEKANAEYFSGK